jgi:hypothetical protein
MLLAARLDIGGSILDCIVLDASPRGARVRFGAPVTVPDRVRLMLRDGSVRDARRRWSRGTQMGLEFIDPGRPQDTPGLAERALGLLAQLRGGDPAAWLPGLRAERYLGDAAVRDAAEAMAAAHQRLLVALQAVSRRDR